MYITQQALDIVGVTYDEYIEWCENTGKMPYKKSVRKEFFQKIFEGRLVRDSITKRIITKKISKNNSEANDED